MDEYAIWKLLEQAEIEDAGAMFRDWMRGMVRQTILRVMESEATALCGALYHPDTTSDCYRVGSAPGSVLHEGRPEEVRRPRIRRRKDDGGSGEVRLSSYEAAREPGHLEDMIQKALCAGVSTREQKNVQPEQAPVSKSAVSRLWVREGRTMLEAFRERDIRRNDWLVLMLDGIRLAEELWAVVALWGGGRRDQIHARF